jgi:glycerol-3-phosphate O-acyltransferase/dihydroxyacetone phosphate acyltransferase
VGQWEGSPASPLAFVATGPGAGLLRAAGGTGRLRLWGTLVKAITARRAGSGDEVQDGRHASRPPRWVVSAARLLLDVFFRGVEVVGEERIPRGRPLVLIANHVNGLVDPLLVLGALPVAPRFLAKSTLWKIPVLSWLLDLARAIPVYRRQDEGSDPTKNEQTFARCYEELAAGGAIAIFPEGTSHNEPALQPLKTGAARIVLGAEARRPRPARPLGVAIVPVGLTFDARDRFRSRALVAVGPPLDPSPEVALYAADPVGAVQALTARIEDALQQVTLNYATWDEARLIARAADLYARPALDVPRFRTLEETFAIRRAMLDGYRDLAARYPERTQSVAEAVRRYDRLLRALHLKDEQVAAAYPIPSVLRFVGRTLLRLLVYLPLALVGSLLNVVPYYLTRLISKIAARESPDQQATYKVFPGMVLYPLAWLAEAWAVGRHAGATWGILTFLAAPPTGYAAIRFHEQRERFARQARAYLLLRTRKKIGEELRVRRGEVYAGVAGLVEVWRGGGESFW